MKRTYESFNEIEADLKKLYLEKEIAYEELKIVKHDFEDHLKPLNWLNSILKMISKYGVLLMIKKMFK
ncbi:DUF6327 family protein [Polaribacter septentrionalilitoris]|uniref:DUF6327 family protein n=1 Tax=Polaribacter septentrionalilitoris TaxID=2494657 RepID=UPI00135B8FA9|nr:DUF6327 family protein [Polaribacter septentrionalilitoris]